MDLFSSAGAFATIVGLLAAFKSERSSSDLSDFYGWLKEKRYEGVENSIRNSEILTQQLSQILSQNHDELIGKLKQLDILMSSIASQIQDFSGLAKTIHSENIFSDQAISILKQFVNSGAKLMIERKMYTGDPDEYFLMEGGHGKIQYNDQRFLEDDLNTLVNTGLLTLQYNKGRSRQFLITRKAVVFSNTIGR